MSKIRGFLITPHSSECWMFNGFNDDHFPWCLPESKWIQPMGHKKKKYLSVFRCSDPQCEGQLGISDKQLYEMYETAMAHLRNKGKPKRKEAQSNG